ncbi:MAG: hypothetical protein ACOCV1_03695 [Bacillota bacterium]
MLRQKERWDCFPTCVSILTGIDRDEIIENLSESKDGYSSSEMAFFLLKKGYSLITFSVKDLEEKLKSVFQECINQSISCILTVKRKSEFHAIVCTPENNRVYDPFDGNYKDLEQIGAVYNIEIITKIDDICNVNLVKEFKKI